MPSLPTCKQYLEQRRTQLHDGLQQVARLIAENRLPDVSLENGALSISPLEAKVPDATEFWSDRLYDLLPRIHLTDLLMEVDSWTGFSRYFVHLYTHQPAADDTLVLTVILAEATNIGLTKIAEAIPKLSYARLSWIADWYVREDNYAKALAEIVGKQHKVPLTPMGPRHHILFGRMRALRARYGRALLAEDQRGGRRRAPGRGELGEAEDVEVAAAPR